MTYEPPEDPHRLPPPPPYGPPQPVDSAQPRPVAPAHARRRGAPPARTILLVVAALAGLCLIGGVVWVAGSNLAKPTGTTAGQGLGDQVPTPSDPLPATPTQPTVTDGPEPSGTATTRPPVTNPGPKATRTKPSASSVRRGVHPGAACSPAGARGVTKTGRPVVCRTTATDSRLRWRPA